MGRGLPDPPPEVPPEKPAEPYKPITFNGPPAPAVQSCKWCGGNKFYLKFVKSNLKINFVFA